MYTLKVVAPHAFILEQTMTENNDTPHLLQAHLAYGCEARDSIDGSNVTLAVTLVLNPSSRNYRGKDNWKFFLNRGMKEIVSKSAEDLLDAVITDENDVAVAVGGDGTINLVINGIMKSPQKKKLGVLYSGTSPDFCKFHAIPTEPEKSILVLLANRSVHIDIAKLSYDDSGEICYFASSCNIGIGATIANISNKIRKYFGDFLGTCLAALISIVMSKPFRAEVIIDGEVVNFDEVKHIAVMKNNFLASGLHFDLDSKSDDGTLHVIVIKKISLGTFLNAYNGKIPPNAYVKKCRTVEIKTTPSQQIEYDGDSYDYTPIKIECLQKALELIK
ncbi:putative lipid kinase BmrU [Alphaproteobacteria bacterium]|nr:putative lipid kinase BmrU [Alphaproteobacteria bacterium]